MGAYSHSKGITFVREDIAKFIEKRDGFPSNPDHIFLFNGASPAVQDTIKLIVRGPKDGVMIPIPQYPLYSGTLGLLGARQVGYYLTEEKNWGLGFKDLEKSYLDAKKDGTDVRALVVINPGNPTGGVLTEADMIEVIKFCKEKNLVLLADEVYQENVYVKSTKKFHSFKKVLRELGKDYNDVQLFSFHSVSKGVTGECGQRGGYVEITNLPEDVIAQIYKVASISICPNTPGQILVDLMVNPPKPGEESHPLWEKETQEMYESLKRRATKLVKFFNTMEGVSCQNAEGAMYLFPQITIPSKAVEEAKKNSKSPDTFYCLELLENTGLCVVPGSGFGQRDGTWHFRTTFLPLEKDIDAVCTKFEKFHKKFMLKYK